MSEEMTDKERAEAVLKKYDKDYHKKKKNAIRRYAVLLFWVYFTAVIGHRIRILR